MPRGASPWARRGGPLLALVSLVATLGVLEIGLRLRAGRQHGAGLAEAAAARPRPGTAVALGEIVRPSIHRRIVYELHPDLDVWFRGAHLTTDPRGFRRSGAPTAVPGRPPFRIVGLGDSYMFGWGVADEETYLSRACARLREGVPSRNWQVVNTAVPGYNTAMEVETLLQKALDPAPQLVVLEVVGNDLDLPNFIQSAPPVWSLRRSFLVDFMAARVRRPLRHPTPEGASPLAAAPTAAGSPRGDPPFEGDPDRVPAAYADLVGWSAFDRSLRELARLRDERGFAVVVLSESPGFDWFERRSHRLARRLGFAYLDVGRVVDAQVAAGGFGDFLESPLALGPDDPHPSAAGHALVADELYRVLTGTGIVTTD